MTATDTIIDLTGPIARTTTPADLEAEHRVATLVDSILTIQETHRAKRAATADYTGSRWSGPKNTEDDHAWRCDCGADCGRTPVGDWVGFDVFPAGDMVCESCDRSVGF